MNHSRVRWTQDNRGVKNGLEALFKTQFVFRRMMDKISGAESTVFPQLPLRWTQDNRGVVSSLACSAPIFLCSSFHRK